MDTPWIRFKVFHLGGLILICLSCYCVCQEEAMLREQQTKARLFVENKYDKTLRPMNHTNVTTIQLELVPFQIMGLDEETSILSMDGFLWMMWLDHRLAFETENMMDYLILPTDMIWTPDVAIFNSHTRQLDPFKQVHVNVFASGFVNWYPTLHSETYCPSAARAYPADRVDCLIELGSWASDGWKIDFVHHPQLYLEWFEDINPRWSLIKSEARVVVNETNYGEHGRFVKVDFHLPLQRRPVPEIEASRTSCNLVMALTLAIFWLPVDSGKKVQLGGILFLVLNLLLVFVAFSTKFPLAVVYAVSFVQSAMYVLVATMFLQLLVVTRLASFRGPSRPPAPVVHLLTGVVGRLACLGGQQDGEADRVQLKEDFPAEDRGPSGLSAREEWRLVATAADRVLFVVMAVAAVSVRHL